MLDRDLAELYGVTTGQLNRQVKRNIKRFPSDFMFQLTKEDCLRCQIGILNGRRGEHLKFMPYAFTENGIAMLSSVLRSDATLLDILSEKAPGVTVRLVCKDRGKPTRSEIEKFNRQYKGLTVEHSDSFHDRYILIDNAELHNLGSSINYLGCRVTNYSTRGVK